MPGPAQVSGTLQAGTLRPGQKLLLLPGAEMVLVSPQAQSAVLAGSWLSALASWRVAATPPAFSGAWRRCALGTSRGAARGPQGRLRCRREARPESPILRLSNTQAKAVHSRGAAVTLATAGDHVEIGLVGCAADSSIAQGSVLCDPLRPAPLARKVEVRLRMRSRVKCWGLQ